MVVGSEGREAGGVAAAAAASCVCVSTWVGGKYHGLMEMVLLVCLVWMYLGEVFECECSGGGGSATTI